MSNSVVERRLAGWRLGAALVGLAIPFAVALPAAAQSAGDVSDTAQACMGLGYTTSQCTHAIEAGVVDVAEAAVNSTLANQGIDQTVNTGLGTPPLTITYNSGNPAVPAVPVIPVPPVPGISY